mgnify:CR=1 FL=1
MMPTYGWWILDAAKGIYKRLGPCVNYEESCHRDAGLDTKIVDGFIVDIRGVSCMIVLMETKGASDAERI